MEREKSVVESVVESLEPFMEKLTALRQTDELKRRREEEKAKRRRAQQRVRVEYQIMKDGTILHEGKAVALDMFVTQIVTPLRRRNWITFRGYARPETPFGLVVETRRRLLENQGEFDTYWDNLTRER